MGEQQLKNALSESEGYDCASVIEPIKNGKPDRSKKEHDLIYSNEFNGEPRPDDLTTYQQAKKAVELFESEYIGQDQADLWKWAINEAKRQ